MNRNVYRVFLDELRVSSFPGKFPHYAWTAAKSAHSDFDGSKVYACFRCNLPPAHLAEWLGSFTCHCGNTEVKRTMNKSQHTKLSLEKKFLPPLLPGFELSTFRSRVRRSNQQAMPALSPHFFQTLRPPQWGAADVEIKVPSGKNTELKHPPCKAWSRSVYSHTCYAYCQGFLPYSFLPVHSIHLHFSKTPLDFFLCWLWLTPVPVQARRIQ